MHCISIGILNSIAYMKTSLRPYMVFFERKFLLPLLKEENKKKREEGKYKLHYKQ